MKTTPTDSLAKFSRRDALRLLGVGGATLAAAPLFSSLARAANAPSLLGPQPSYYRFRVGDIEAVALNDGGVAGSLKDMGWWAGVPEAQFAAALESAFEPPTTIRLAFTVLLLRTDDKLVLIDSGCGPLFGPIGGHLLESLAAIAIKPEQIDAVVLSHAHGDHFGGLLDAKKQPVFPNARLYINRAEYDFWTQPAPDLTAVSMPPEAKHTSIVNAQDYLTTLKDRWTFIAPGDKPIKGLEIIAAPGHTPGHVAVMISSGEEHLLHVADAVHHHAFSFEHPEWKFVADVQPDVAQQTRRTLLERAARERLRIYGAHLPFPAIGHVRKEDGHFEYIIEPWTPV